MTVAALGAPGDTVAVVVPSHNRGDLLRRCLRGLVEQTRRPDRVVVIDDGSQPPTAPVIREFSDQISLSTLRNNAALGPAAARNQGWRSCQTGYIAFTDDDCRPAPDWLETLMRAAAPARVLVGRTLPDPQDGPPDSVFDRAMHVERCDGGFPTCNVLYPRQLLEQLGGFDISFKLPYGEDTDLGQRAVATGAGAVYVDEAVVFHALHRHGLRAAVAERRRMPELARLARRHPQLRSQIWKGAFLNMDHRLLLEAAAGAALLPAAPTATALMTRRPGGGAKRVAARAAVGTAMLPLTIAAMAPLLRYLYWADQRTRNLPRHGRLRNVAEITFLDAVEVAYLAAGSLRHRTLLL